MVLECRLPFVVIFVVRCWLFLFVCSLLNVSWHVLGSVICYMLGVRCALWVACCLFVVRGVLRFCWRFAFGVCCVLRCWLLLVRGLLLNV